MLDGVRYDFKVSTGSKIKESGGSDVKEQGDTFFSTNDNVAPPSSGPFAGLSSGKMVFSTTSSFATGQTTTITRESALDLNGDGDTADPGESGNSQFNATQAMTPPCFASGTRILTPWGARPVEDLRPGDRVTLAGGGSAPFLLTLARPRRFSRWDHPHKPVLIAAGALGPGRPARDLILSPQHCVLATPAQLGDLAAGGECLVRAKALVGFHGIRRMRGLASIVYHTLLLPRHDLVIAEGIVAESFYPGRVALGAMPTGSRAALARVFPGIADDPAAVYGPPARRVLTVAETRHRASITRAVA